MKIAFTADCHLTTRSKNPERFQALSNIFNQCKDNDVQLLVIAGDLFDKDLPNFAEFEELYRSSRTGDMATVIIPGNHDQRLSQGALIGEGLLVYSELTLKPLNDSRKILFLPYQDNKTMGELIAQFAEKLQGQRWVLVSHGDWTAGRNTPDPYEKGLYMPLTRIDLDTYQPELVFLGHIHLAQQDQNLYYPGSPCPLDISETGLRQFLIMDTEQGEVTSHLVDSPLLYFNERFIMLPTENGLDLLLKDIDHRIENWDLPQGWENRVQLRVEISGSSSFDKQKVLNGINKAFSGFSYYKNEEPRLSELVYNIDPDRIEISNQVTTWINNLDWKDAPGLPTKMQILDQALKIIHGGK
ncbi:MAG: hypothetical protein DRI65_04300 [Chloroflexota bacterium]|nr:MAG: hypothetical protein DRI65_04300 [Chloroflexota bacterium]